MLSKLPLLAASLSLILAHAWESILVRIFNAAKHFFWTGCHFSTITTILWYIFVVFQIVAERLCKVLMAAHDSHYRERSAYSFTFLFTFRTGMQWSWTCTRARSSELSRQARVRETQQTLAIRAAFIRIGFVDWKRGAGKLHHGKIFYITEKNISEITFLYLYYCTKKWEILLRVPRAASQLPLDVV